MADGRLTVEGLHENTLRCPKCGGDNQLGSGVRVLECAFCGAALHVDRAGLIQRYRLPRLLDKEQAEAALKRWMAGNDTVKDLDRKATIGESRLVSFPLWMFRMRSSGGGVVRVEPAAATPVPAMADLKIPAGQLEPYQGPADEVKEVQISVPLETAKGWMGEAADQVEETSVVHVPLWRFRYTFGGRDFVALVDGSTGAVLASVFPAKRESPYYAVAGCGCLAFTIAGFATTNLLLKLALFALLTVPLIGAAYWVARKV